MIKFDVLKIYSGEVQFTSEIECSVDEKKSWKLRLAVLWAIENSADLCHADLRHADLSSANLSYANLSYADLRSAMGNGRELKSIIATKYRIAWSETHMAIGCEQHTIKQWLRFTKKQISKMDEGELEWWKVWKPIIKSIIDAG